MLFKSTPTKKKNPLNKAEILNNFGQMMGLSKIVASVSLDEVAIQASRLSCPPEKHNAMV